MKVVKGVLGWGNRKHGLEAYGPGGRWQGETSAGDLLGDAFSREGSYEGDRLVAFSFPRGTTEDEIDAFIANAKFEWRKTHPNA